MASIVGKTIFSDGKGKLFFGYYKDNDAVEFVDYKTWKKLSFKDVSKGDANKERVIKAIVKNQKQFNKKVDFNMWAKQKKRTFEETMDWFIKNGWISNVTKRGIKESVDVLSINEVNVDDALSKFTKELEKSSQVKKAAKHYKKSVKDIVKILASRFKLTRYSDKSVKSISINFKDNPSNITFKLSHSYKQNESVNEDRNSNMFYVLYQKKGVFGKPVAAGYKDRKDAEKFAKSLGNNHNTMILDKQSMKNVKGVDVKESVNEAASRTAMEIGGLTGMNKDAIQKFVDDNNLDIEKVFQFVKKGKLKDRMELVSAIAGKPNNPVQKKMIKMFGESVDEGILQDREKQIKALPKGARVSGGGYGPFIKTGSNTFKSPKGQLANSQAVIKLLGAFGDFKIHEDKGEVEKIKKQVGNNEIKFYDALSKVEKRLGSKYPKFLDTALKQLKQNPSKFKTNADKEEAIFQSVK